MRKNLFKISIVFFSIIEIILIIFNYIGKSNIANILEIENINDFYIKDLGESLGLDSARPLYIKFKISIDKYEKYNLTYIDTALDDNVYEGEITNKFENIFCVRI